MKRRLVTIAVFLLAGAVVNVAVAWGCAQLIVDFTGYSGTRELRREQTKTLIAARIPGVDTIPVSQVEGTQHCGIGWTFVQASWRDDSVDAVHDIYLHVLVVGWPLDALEGWWQMVGMKDSSPWLPGWTSGSREVLLPLRPTLPGFLVNTLLYAAVLWLLICGPFALRRHIRRRRGLCPGCGYPVGESDVCSECGIALPSREATT